MWKNIEYFYMCLYILKFYSIFAPQKFNAMILLGFDIGSSSVKASLVETESGQCVASAFFPKQEK